MNVIAAIDENYAIGYKQNLLARLPEDMKRFKAITLGNVVVMGKNTYLSLPSRPLADRKTIIFTHTPEEFPEAYCFSSVDEFLCLVKTLEESGKEIYVCGGGLLYKTLLPYCKNALITKIFSVFESDTWFPNIDNMPEWEKTNESQIIQTNGYNIQFIDYKNKSNLI